MFVSPVFLKGCKRLRKRRNVYLLSTLYIRRGRTMPDLIFHESEIKYRKIIDHISQTALKDGKIYVDRKALNEFVEGEDILEIIVRKKS